MSKKLIPAYLLTFVNVLGFSILMPVLPFVVQDYGAPKWVYGLLKDIPGFEVQYNEHRSGKEYDFIVWNSTESEELLGLGNPIPIEVKASNYVENNLIHFLNHFSILASSMVRLFLQENLLHFFMCSIQVYQYSLRIIMYHDTFSKRLHISFELYQ